MPQTDITVQYLDINKENPVIGGDSLEKSLFKQSEILMARRDQLKWRQEQMLSATSPTFAECVKLLVMLAIAGLLMVLSVINEPWTRQIVAAKMISAMVSYQLHTSPSRSTLPSRRPKVLWSI